jgi:hypothetical protein
VFGDGAKLDPNEFGRLSLRWSLQYGEGLIEELFATGKPGWMLLGGASIYENPVYAHSYMTMLFLSTFIAYTEGVLHAEESVIIEVREGIHEAMIRIQLPPQRGETDLLEHLKKVLEQFFRAIVQDLQNQDSPDTGLKPHKATEYFYSLVKAVYGFENSDFTFLSHSPDELPYALEVQRAIDQVPLALIATLHDKVQVRLVADD